MIATKRAYDPADRKDGARLLVDRLWPRGLTKEDLQIEGWLKEVAPSTELRKQFGHKPELWEEFLNKYFAELDHKESDWMPILERAKEGKVTLIYAAKDVKYNNAVALKQYLESKEA